MARQHGTHAMATSLKGIIHPFGSRADFFPPKPTSKEVHKLAPRAIPGIFVGCVVAQGAHFGGLFVGFSC